jgi:cytochrome b
MGAGMSGTTRLVRVWDAPTRLFHWAIALLVGFSWFSMHESWMELHFLSGYTILALLLFRLVWGFIGSDTARFGRFLASPAAAFRHLAHIHRREPDAEIGHNAAGGWMVLLMLALLLVQVGSGLFANDDIMNEGPLAHLVGKSRSDWFTNIHSINFTLIEIAVAAHVVAVLAYAVLKRQDLVRPMVTGSKRLPAGLRAPRMASLWLAIAVLAVAAGCVALLVNFA